ncbi:MAG: glycogen debranching protein [Actinomycetota bacterium]|nr:glycogen debranching protein [Actinomycetota bacterium]
MSRRRSLACFVAALTSIPVAVTAPGLVSGAAAARMRPPSSERALPRSPEVSASQRLAQRRSFVIGTRFYEAGAEDASYPAEGFHTRGEMGGFWSMPIKLLDGVWFKVDGSWLRSKRYSSGWGYTRMDLGSAGGVHISRTDFAPDGLRAGLIGLTMSSTSARTVTLTMDAHSELMSVYPWGETSPNQLQANLPDRGSYQNGSLVFRDVGTPPIQNSTRHSWAAVVGSSMSPRESRLGSNYRGPQSGDVVCPASGPSAPPQPPRCDDTAYGKGTGGELVYRVSVPQGRRTVWFSVGGSDQGLNQARRSQTRALAHPAALLRDKIASRRVVEARSQVTLPGDPLLARSVTWSKQNLADSRQRADHLRLRVTNAGTQYPPPVGGLSTARWIGAGWPDYPWIFGTDGEYSAFGAVATGQFASIENHLRTLMRISDIVNRRSGKVIHEATPDGSVYFGANSDAGNTDETVKFPSAVALVWRWTGDNAFRDEMYGFTVRNMRYVFRRLDADTDGWPEGAGNVERAGMGEEKLDNTVYAVRGLLDLATMAASRHDTATLRWATAKAVALRSRFERQWWYGNGSASYADSLKDPGNHRLFQRYWIGLTPVEAELPRINKRRAGPLASGDHARQTVRQHELACYTGRYGLYHTGTGPTSDAKGNPGPSCDSVVSTAPSDREIFTLTTSIAAVAEAALGRMGPHQMSRYADANATVQLNPSVWETPGAMPEISPSPDFGSNMSKLFTERSSGLQAWGTYGVLWPVVHYELGVAPDLGIGRVSVVPQVPVGQHEVRGSNIRLGSRAIDVYASRHPGVLETSVTSSVAAALTLGVVLPTGKHVTSATMDGSRVRYRVVMTPRGSEVLVAAGRAGRHTLRVHVG